MAVDPNAQINLPEVVVTPDQEPASSMTAGQGGGATPGIGGADYSISNEPPRQPEEKTAGGQWFDLEGRPVFGGQNAPAPPPQPQQVAPQPSPLSPVPDEGRHLLDLIASPESGGQYDIRYTPGGGARDFGLGSHPRIKERIPTGPYAGLTSDAAGRYQILSSTWDPIAQRLGVNDFSQDSQDAVAWELAQQSYKRRTGRELLADLRTPRGADLNALRGEWATLPRAFLVSPKPAALAQAATKAGTGFPASWTPLDPQTPPGTAEAAAPQSPAQAASAWTYRPGANPGADRERFDKAFDRSHAIERDGWLWSLASSILPGINEGLSDILGLPGAAVHDAMVFGGAGSWFSPLPWKEPAKSAQTLTGALNLVRPPMPQEIREYGRAGGLSFAPSNESAPAGIGHAIGTTIGFSAPLAGAGAVWPEFLVGQPRLQAQARTAPAKFLANEGLVEPAAAGFGAGDAGEIYRSLTGDQSDPMTQSVVAGVGGLLLSPRIPVVGALSRTGARVANVVYQRAMSLMGAKPLNVAHMTPDQARVIVGGMIRQRMQDALDEARFSVSTMATPRSIELNGLSGSALQTRAAERVSTELKGFLADGANTEKLLWKDVDPTLPRDFGGAKRTVALMKDDFDKAVREDNRDPGDFPGQLARLFEDRAQTAEGASSGLSSTDTLGAGQNIHHRIQQAIREEAAKEAPNRAKIGFLSRMDGALMDDIANGPQGSTLEAVKAYRNALAFSHAFADIRNSNEIFDVLARDRSGAERLGAAETLDKFLKTGQAGVSAARQLQSAAEMRYGPDGMIEATKDALRQKYVEQVAPQGYISLQDHTQFVTTKYDGLLSNPRFADLKEELNKAAFHERDAAGLLSLGENRTKFYGTSLTQADARAARADLWLDRPVETVMQGLMRAPNQEAAANSVIAQLRRDPTGDAIKGFATIVADVMLSNPQGFAGLSGWLKQNAGLVAALDRAVPGFAQRAQGVSSVGSGAGQVNFVADLAARWAGSQAMEHMTKGMGSRLVMASAGSRLFRQWVENLSAAQAKQLTAAAVVDPAVYNALQSASVTGALKDFQFMHLYVPGLAIPAVQGSYGLNEEQQKEINDRVSATPALRGSVPIAPRVVPGAGAGAPH